MSLSTDDITGLILCGGRGSRMGGVDKGLQNYQGMPLAMHALLRLSPQVGHLMINANRNLAAYESMGVPVWLKRWCAKTPISPWPRRWKTAACRCSPSSAC